ncbi:ThiF family protein [Tritrichomonas foetus]|uniref:NEDD8-activating enzyme E1 regulatory subunit n=1 Tax=Tritrichomonas foetus TaxID=1144522 RepID=A0A1J4K1E3_9EUKA|nr:ThiF family protein [Tritrichomonas foetus]|eukprot:OHT03564.1 ThiF family protein [Tritrichomonas foetus]
MSQIDQDERNSRQLILWGPHGQVAVTNSRIFVLGSDCVATEFLKNIVLHGFGYVTVIDDAIVSDDDLRTNFFVDAEHKGKSRAETVAELLQELNLDSRVTGLNRSPFDLSFISEDPKPNFVVTCGNLKPSFLEELSKVCRANKVHQAHIQTVGFFGSFYIDAGLHEIYEGSNTAKYPLEELRVPNPFPELLEFINSFDFENCSDKEHSHIPSVAVFYKAREAAAKELGVTVDKLSSDQILSQIKKMRRVCIVNNELIAEIGFSEAEEKIYNYMYPRVPSATREVFSLSDKIGEVDEPFWHLVRATQRFYNTNKVLPHYGGCPDLDTSTENFIKIKKIYEEKGEKDWQQVRNDLNEKGVTIDDSTFKRFSQNVWRIGAVNYQTIPELIELKPSPMFENDPKDKNISIIQCIFIAFRKFFEKNGRQPQNTQEDRDSLFAEVKELGVSLDDEQVKKYIQEFSRAKNNLIPSVAATFAAILAEEVTKIAIKQACPVKGVFLYDSMANYAQARW